MAYFLFSHCGHGRWTEERGPELVVTIVYDLGHDPQVGMLTCVHMRVSLGHDDLT